MIVFIALVIAGLYAYKYSKRRSQISNQPPSHTSFSNPIYDTSGSFIDSDEPTGITGYMDVPEPDNIEHHNRNSDENYLVIDHQNEFESNL